MDVRKHDYAFLRVHDGRHRDAQYRKDVVDDFAWAHRRERSIRWDPRC